MGLEGGGVSGKKQQTLVFKAFEDNSIVIKAFVREDILGMR